jgi:hypothetical protein
VTAPWGLWVLRVRRRAAGWVTDGGRGAVGGPVRPPASADIRRSSWRSTWGEEQDAGRGRRPGVGPGGGLRSLGYLVARRRWVGTSPGLSPPPSTGHGLRRRRPPGWPRSTRPSAVAIDHRLKEPRRFPSASAGLGRRRPWPRRPSERWNGPGLRWWLRPLTRAVRGAGGGHWSLGQGLVIPRDGRAWWDGLPAQGQRGVGGRAGILAADAPLIPATPWTRPEVSTAMAH